MLFERTLFIKAMSKTNKLLTIADTVVNQTNLASIDFLFSS